MPTKFILKDYRKTVGEQKNEVIIKSIVEEKHIPFTHKINFFSNF